MPFDCWHSKELIRNIEARHLSYTVPFARPLSGYGIFSKNEKALSSRLLAKKGEEGKSFALKNEGLSVIIYLLVNAVLISNFIMNEEGEGRGWWDLKDERGGGSGGAYFSAIVLRLLRLIWIRINTHDG
jgi:hypothetical protein